MCNVGLCKTVGLSYEPVQGTDMVQLVVRAAVRGSQCKMTE